MKILMILAHPDDEVIFAWPVLQKIGCELSLLTLADNHAKRGTAPIKVLEEVCKINNIRLINRPRLDTNFSRLPPRFEKVLLEHAIKSFRQSIQYSLDLIKPDFVFTHNPMGEYGHGDHKFIHSLVSQFPVAMCFTDICSHNQCHLSTNKIPKLYLDYLYKNATSMEKCSLNIQWYDKMKTIYEKNKAWTWGGNDVTPNCNLYFFA